MQTKAIYREVTPLSAEDCFVIIDRTKSEFTYPVHVHPEYELNFIENAGGAQRVIGDSIETIGNLDLCLVGNENLEHGWMNGNCKSTDIHEITIQFHNDLFFESLLNKKQFHTVAIMLEKAKKGIIFSENAILLVKEKLNSLTKKESGFYSVIELINILYLLSIDSGSRTLSSGSFANSDESSDSRRIQKVINFLHDNYHKDICLEDVARYVNMSEVSLSRFMKKRTGKNYIDFLNDLRLGIASRQLVDTTKSVSEICFESGFNNLSNFNRIFKKRKGVTPKEFRENYTKMRIMI